MRKVLLSAVIVACAVGMTGCASAEEVYQNYKVERAAREATVTPTGPVCPVDVTGGWEDVRDRLIPYAQEFYSASPSVAAAYSQASAHDERWEYAHQMLEAMGCTADATAEFSAVVALKGVHELAHPYVAPPTTPNTDGNDTNTKTWCSWSFKGGFNCGVRVTGD